MADLIISHARFIEALAEEAIRYSEKYRTTLRAALYDIQGEDGLSDDTLEEAFEIAREAMIEGQEAMHAEMPD